MIYVPTQEDLFTFVASTHDADRIHLNMQDIKDTWSGAKRCPFSHGHFLAFQFANKMVNSIDFPAKEPNLLTDLQKSHQALNWVRKMQTFIVEPLVNAPELMSDPNGPKSYHLGAYRLQSTTAVYRETVPPTLIPGAMHNWIKDISTFHHSIKPKLSNPYGFKNDEAKEIMVRIHEIPLFFSVVQPFNYANQRLGRMIELCFRWAWGLPQIMYWANSKPFKTIVDDLQEYEKRIPEICAKALTIK